jgi:hypothetical protein
MSPVKSFALKSQLKTVAVIYFVVVVVVVVVEIYGIPRKDVNSNCNINLMGLDAMKRPNLREQTVRGKTFSSV